MNKMSAVPTNKIIEKYSINTLLNSISQENTYTKVDIDKLSINDLTLSNLKEIFPLFYLYKRYTMNYPDMNINFLTTIQLIFNQNDSDTFFQNYITLHECQYLSRLNELNRMMIDIYQNEFFQKNYQEYKYFLNLYDRIIHLINEGEFSFQITSLPQIKNNKLFINIKYKDALYQDLRNYYVNTKYENICNYLGILSMRQKQIFMNCHSNKLFNTARHKFKIIMDNYYHYVFNNLILSLGLLDEFMNDIFQQFIEQLNKDKTQYNTRTIKMLFKAFWLDPEFDSSIIDKFFGLMVLKKI